MLTLEKLSHYLPHEVKVWHKERIMKMVTAQGSSRHWIGIGAVLSAQQYYGPKPKLILRPPSDLTNPITVPGYNDGKEFVPVVKLFEIASGINYFDDPIQDIFEIRQNNPVHFLCFELNRHMGLTFDVDLLSFHLFDDDRYQVETKNQLLLFKMLYKWHFAVDIEESDYIDINTLKS